MNQETPPQQASFRENLRQLFFIKRAQEAVDLIANSEEIEDIAFRLKAFQSLPPQKLLELYQKLSETLNRIDSPLVKRGEIPGIVRDVLRQIGLGTQLAPSQPQARDALNKAVKAAAAAVQYYQENPGRAFDLNKAKDIVARNVLKRKNGEG